jgi:prophage regulatory protein
MLNIETTAPGNSMERKLLRGWGAVSRATGKSRVQLWRDIRAKRFPPPIELGPNSVAWFEDEINEWLASRPRRTYQAAGPLASTASQIMSQKVPRRSLSRPDRTADKENRRERRFNSHLHAISQPPARLSRSPEPNGDGGGGGSQ